MEECWELGAKHSLPLPLVGVNGWNENEITGNGAFLPKEWGI